MAGPGSIGVTRCRFPAGRVLTRNRCHFVDGGFNMRHAFLSGAALILAIAGGSSLAAQPGIAARPADYSSGPGVASQGPSVLLVCNGSTAPCPALPRSARPYYRTVQGAVDAARSGDWILIYPGVYHEKSRQWPTAGVWIQKPNLHIR